MDNKTNIVGESSIMLYTNSDNTIQLEVKLEQETVWLTQIQMAQLFGTDRTSIVRHINNIYKCKELEENSTCAKNAQVRLEGRRQVVRQIPYYNLDMILSVGYRVNSKNAIAFRHWASNVLKDYIVKGYAVRDQLQLQHYNDQKNIVGLMSRTMALQEQPKGDEYKGPRKKYEHEEEHISKLRNMLSGEAFAQYRESIRLTGHPLLLRTKEQDPWKLTEEEARNILHDYAPELSLVLNGPTIVIFYEKK